MSRLGVLGPQYSSVATKGSSSSGHPSSFPSHIRPQAPPHTPPPSDRGSTSIPTMTHAASTHRSRTPPPRSQRSTGEHESTGFKTSDTAILNNMSASQDSDTTSSTNTASKARMKALVSDLEKTNERANKVINHNYGKSAVAAKAKAAATVEAAREAERGKTERAHEKLEYESQKARAASAGATSAAQYNAYGTGAAAGIGVAGDLLKRPEIQVFLLGVILFLGYEFFGFFRGASAIADLEGDLIEKGKDLIDKAVDAAGDAGTAIKEAVNFVPYQQYRRLGPYCHDQYREVNGKYWRLTYSEFGGVCNLTDKIEITQSEYNGYKTSMNQIRVARIWSTTGFNDAGTWQDVQPGRYDYFPDNWQVYPNDMEGLQVATGYRVLLYSGLNCIGYLAEYTAGNYTTLGIYNNKVRSIRILSASDSYVEVGAVFFFDPGWTPPGTQLPIGSYETLDDTGLIANHLGSFRLPAGIDLYMYTRQGCVGSTAWYPGGANYGEPIKYAIEKKYPTAGDNCQSIRLLPSATPRVEMWWDPGYDVGFVGGHWVFPIILNRQMQIQNSAGFSDGYLYNVMAVDNSLDVGVAPGHFGSWKVPAPFWLVCFTKPACEGPGYAFLGNIPDNIAAAQQAGYTADGRTFQSFLIYNPANVIRNNIVTPPTM